MSNLILFILIVVLVAMGAAWIFLLNKRHAAMRERMGKSARVVDLSMESSRALKVNDEVVNDTAGTGVGERAFDDVTDLENEDFIFVY